MSLPYKPPDATTNIVVPSAIWPMAVWAESDSTSSSPTSYTISPSTIRGCINSTALYASSIGVPIDIYPSSVNAITFSTFIGLRFTSP